MLHDNLPVIRYITRLFWGRFPYKAETVLPARRFKFDETKPIFSESRRYRRCVDTFRNYCLRSVPEDPNVWRIHETDFSMHFYFLEKEDMRRFVTSNPQRIRAIFEPKSEADISILTQEKDLLIRPTLFLNQYQYCVVFRAMTESVANDIDEWVKEVLDPSNDVERTSYSFCGIPRKLYMNNENDILMTRLAFNNRILKVQKIILRSEIS